MSHTTVILLGVALSLYSALHAVFALRSGRAPGLFQRWLGARTLRGSITRKGRPELFRRYVASAIIAAVLFVALTTWLLLHPETARGGS
jgi:hypothetical protein